MAKCRKNSAQEQNVIRQIEELNRISMAELRKKWQDVFGTDSKRFGRTYLIRRLAYRIQELIYGGISQESRRRAKNISETEAQAIKKRECSDLQVGTRLVREWHGQKYEVIVKEDGFLSDGKIYRSLSAVARKITGRHCGGRRFFGLQPGSKRKRGVR